MEKTKVLFVDDDIALGQVVILALRASGYAAEYCTTLVGIQGVVQEMQPDIMVLDVEIGEKNGIDAVAELKLTAPDTPVLFVSSHIAGSEVARALDAGGIAYLRKPFEMEELVAYIRRHTPCFHPKGLSIGMFNLRAGDSMLFKGEEPVRRLTDFEYKLHTMAENNEPLSSKVITDLYAKLNQEYYGDDVVMDDLVGWSCYYVPHFYYNYYVYKYTLGMTAALAIVNRILKGDQNQVENYLNFLKSGGSMAPVDLLKKAGIDPLDYQIYEDAFNYFEDLLNQFEAIKKSS